MKTRKIRFCSALFALLLVVGLFAGCAQQGTTSKINRTFEASMAANTLEELCAQSVIIARGTIASIGKSTDYSDSVHTAFTINVTDELKRTKSGTKTEAWFLGGETSTQICTPISGSLPKAGDEYIFFIFEDGSFSPFGKVTDGNVVLESFMNSKLFTDKSAAQQTVSADALVAEIKDIVAAQANTAKQ